MLIKISYYFGEPDKEAAKKPARKLEQFIAGLNKPRLAAAKAASKTDQEIAAITIRVVKLAYKGRTDNYITALLVWAELDDHILINREYRRIQKIQSNGLTMELLPSKEQQAQLWG